MSLGWGWLVVLEAPLRKRRPDMERGCRSAAGGAASAKGLPSINHISGCESRPRTVLAGVFIRSVAADLLAEVRKREQALGVEVDWSVDAMLSAEALPGAQHSAATEFIIHMLGLDICANTIIGNAMHRGISGGQKKRVTSGAVLPHVMSGISHAQALIIQ